MNNDELQKAIDDITRDTAAPAPAEPVTAENEALANEIAGAPTTGEGVTLAPAAAPEVPPAPAPVIPETPAMPPVAEAAPAPAPEAAPVAEAPAPAPAPEPVARVAQAPAPEVQLSHAGEKSADLADVEREALKELYPLLDKVEMTAEEKFDICMKVAEDDETAVSGALKAAKGIADETAKANALLKIVDFVK